MSREETFEDKMTITLHCGSALEVLKNIAAASVQTCVTSPPYYGLRNYKTAKWEGGDTKCNHIDPALAAERERNRKGLANNADLLDGGNRSRDAGQISKEFQFRNVCGKCGATCVDSQIGLEDTPEAYVEKLVSVFREVKRVLKDDGTLWLNLGDSYWGGKGASSQAWSTENQDRDTLQKSYHQISGKGETRPTDGKHPVIKPKDLIGIPWMVAFALRADGWYLRSDIIWHKPNPMPESVKDRCTKSHEYIFLLSKSASYFYDYKAILEPANYDGRKDTRIKGAPKYKENGQTIARHGGERWPNTMPKNLQFDGQQPNTMHKNRAKGLGEPQGYGLSGAGFKGHSGNLDAGGNPLGHNLDGVPARNKRDVWTVNTKPYEGAHFATFPPALIEPCILAGSAVGDVVLDPFNGSGTTGAVALKHGRAYIGIDLNPEYLKLTEERLSLIQPVLFPKVK
jgi:DNA modification methylase